MLKDCVNEVLCLGIHIVVPSRVAPWGNSVGSPTVNMGVAHKKVVSLLVIVSKERIVAMVLAWLRNLLSTVVANPVVFRVRPVRIKTTNGASAQPRLLANLLVIVTKGKTATRDSVSECFPLFIAVTISAALWGKLVTPRVTRRVLVRGLHVRLPAIVLCKGSLVYGDDVPIYSVVLVFIAVTSLSARQEISARIKRGTLRLARNRNARHLVTATKEKIVVTINVFWLRLLFIVVAKLAALDALLV